MSPSTDPAPLEAPDKESLVERNPHGDFAAVEAARAPYDHTACWTLSKTPSPAWQPGDGAVTDDWRNHSFASIDPHAPDRTEVMNYKLFISTTVPRPIAICSTLTRDGTPNLAPFSYWQLVCSDPPLYSLSLVGTQANDTLQNILDTGECCISTTSDWMIE